MSNKDKVIEKAGVLAIELDTLAGVLADVMAKFNEKVEEANELIAELEDTETGDGPDYLVEVDMSDCDPAGFGDELRLTFDLPLKNGKPSKYAPGPSKGQFESYAHKPITEDEFAVNKAKAVEMGGDDPHPFNGKLFELNSYRYFVVGVDADTLTAVRARNGELHSFVGGDVEKILAKLDEDTKPVL